MHVLSKGSDMGVHAVLVLICLCNVVRSENEYVTAVGDPGMKRDGLRLAIESWNQCNEVGEETPSMGSPRSADCFDIYKASPQQGQFSSVFVVSLNEHSSPFRFQSFRLSRIENSSVTFNFSRF